MPQTSKEENASYLVMGRENGASTRLLSDQIENPFLFYHTDFRGLCKMVKPGQCGGGGGGSEKSWPSG